MRPALAALVLALLATPPLAAQGEVVLTPSDVEPGLMFGIDVSLSGSGLLVGASEELNAGAGKAYVFRSTPAGWVEEAKLEAPGSVALGHAVALAGDRAFVGAPNTVHASGNVSGAVYLFERAGAGWGAPTQLLPSDAATSTGFGQALAAEAGRLVVAGTDRAYVFEPVGGAWTETAILAGEPEPLLDVDLCGNRAVLVHSTGFVFEHDGTAWDAGTALDLTGGQPPLFGGTGYDRFAALDDDHVALLVVPHICQAAEMHGFERLPGEWRKSSVLSLSSSNVSAVAMDRGRLAVNNGDKLVVVRALPSRGWVEEETLVSPIPGTSALGGVDIEGHLGVLGNPFDGAGIPLGGAARVWELSPLAALPEAVSVVSGGTQELELRRGPLQAFSFYWIFGSATGTSPGLTVDGLAFPLNFDPYYLFLVQNPNTVVSPTLGLLDEKGRAPAEVTFAPIDPALVGLTLHHAYLTIRLVGGPLVDFASNAVPLRLATESDLLPEDFEGAAPDWDFGLGPVAWQIVEDGECGAVTRMAAYTSAAPSCGGDLVSPITNARLTSAPFRLGEVRDYELRLRSILTPGLQARVRLFVGGAESAYFEVAWPFDFNATGALESLSFHVPGIEFAIGEEAHFELLLNGVPSGSPAGWWVDEVELVKLP